MDRQSVASEPALEPMALEEPMAPLVSMVPEEPAVPVVSVVPEEPAVPVVSTVVGGGAGWSWRFRPVDMAVSGLLLVVSIAGCLSIAWHLRRQTRELEARQMAVMTRSRTMETTLKQMEARRVMLTRLRRAVERYTTEVESRPIVPWASAVHALSAQRPEGLWATRLSGDGPRFDVEVSAERPDLVVLYIDRLRQAQFVDFAALPAGAAPSVRSRVVGRMMGE